MSNFLKIHAELFRADGQIWRNW